MSQVARPGATKSGKVGNKDRRLQLALFRVGKFTCALDIDVVQEINRNALATVVHDAPSYVRGIINLRGHVVTVIDLRAKLGLPPLDTGRTPRGLVVKSHGELVGLLVDDVDDIVEVASGDITPTPPHLSGDFGSYFSGVYQLESDLVVVLDLDHLLDDTSQQ
jgi:purine-binding chemotaxis protein CheW